MTLREEAALADLDAVDTKEPHLARMRMEMRRGLLSLAVLAALREEQYGYSLRKKLAEVDIDIEEGTLYPLVRRLESYGLLESEWRESDNRNKRYYRISPEGAATLDELARDWDHMVASLRSLMEENA